MLPPFRSNSQTTLRVMASVIMAFMSAAVTSTSLMRRAMRRKPRLGQSFLDVRPDMKEWMRRFACRTIPSLSVATHRSK